MIKRAIAPAFSFLDIISLHTSIIKISGQKINLYPPFIYDFSMLWLWLYDYDSALTVWLFVLISDYAA